MNTYTTLIPAKNQTAVALGFFDGVHKGHMSVVKKVVNCKNNDLESTVVTFLENPIKELTGDNIPFLTSNEEKQNIFKQLGVQNLYMIDFKTVMKMSAKEFVVDLLIKKLNAKKIFCGFNYHFGQGGISNSDTLKELCNPFGVNVVVCEPELFENEPISSTRIRKEVAKGDLKDANIMLDRCFSFYLPVISGNHIGRILSTPTFNQLFATNQVVPKYGVYITAVEMDNKIVCGVTNIGVKPTIGSQYPLAETWLPEYSPGDLYDRKIKVNLIEYLRPEKKFAGLKELKTAILRDGQQAVNIFNRNKYDAKL